MVKPILKLNVCYFIGLVAGIWIFGIIIGDPLPLFLLAFWFAFAAFFSAPILFLVVLAFLLFGDRILRHLSFWCLVTPPLIALIWLTLGWTLDYTPLGGRDAYSHLPPRAILVYALLGSICASISSALFWFWQRNSAGPVEVPGERMRGKSILIWALAIAALQLGGVAMLSGIKGTPLSQASSSDPALQGALVSALTAVAELRKTNHKTQIDCTEYFKDFNRYQDTGPYLSFLTSIGIPTNAQDINGKRHVWFELDRSKLSALGFPGFSRNDRLVIGFTTSSAASTEVTSFKATLLNDSFW